jgi:hypothetical protein
MKGQTVAVSNIKENRLYLGIDNPLEVVVENLKCNSILIKTDNGKIEGESCKYRIAPAKIGRANISVYKLKGKDTTLIVTKEFRVKNIPKPTAKIAGKSFGTIKKNLLAAQYGIKAELDDFDFDIHFNVSSYSVIVVSNQDSIFVRKIEGARFTKEMSEEFLKLQQNDKVYFVDIIAIWPDSHKDNLNSIEFLIE